MTDNTYTYKIRVKTTKLKELNMTPGEYIEQQYENSTLFTSLKEPLMITLDQAIELATQAHEGQWRKSQDLDNDSIDHYSKTPDDILFPYILLNGNKVFYKSDRIVMQKPYITHSLAVMEMMTTDEEKIVAVLHDVFEDNENYKLLSILYKSYSQKWSKYIIETPEKHQIELSSSIWCALHSLTRQNGDWGKFKEKGVYQPYIGYIKDISQNKLATKVKLADIVCTLSDNPSEHAKQKYLKALPILLKGI